MSIITDIKKQKRSDTRYSVYLDGEYEFGLSDLDLGTSGLRIGQVLGPVEIEEFKKQADQSKAYALAVRFLGVRPRSRREIQDYLARKGSTPEDTERVIERLAGLGLVNDRAFATSWVANRQLLRPRSKRQLEQELMAKGLSRDDISPVLAELDGDIEVATLLGVIEKKRRLPQYQNSEKLMGYLSRQGYSYDLIKKALTRLDE